jgi:hypothetical protein
MHGFLDPAGGWQDDILNARVAALCTMVMNLYGPSAGEQF